MTTRFPKILGLIPARMGSRGVPFKNMKPLGGKPLIQYTIEAALESDLLDKVLVSTDSNEIAGFVNRFNGISAPFLRQAHLATAHTPMIDVAVDALTYANNEWGDFEFLVLLQPTAPFRTPGLIDLAIGQIIEENADSLISVRKIPDAFNPYWAYKQKAGFLEKALPLSAHPAITRRQDLPETYYRDGEIYIARTALIREGMITGGKISAWINENEFGINIDTTADWSRAENLLQQWTEQTKSISSC
jgi:CMP-N,N'-diacetyllegionaminic acid synthase